MVSKGCFRKSVDQQNPDRARRRPGAASTTTGSRRNFTRIPPAASGQPLPIFSLSPLHSPRRQEKRPHVHDMAMPSRPAPYRTRAIGPGPTRLVRRAPACLCLSCLGGGWWAGGLGVGATRRNFESGSAWRNGVRVRRRRFALWWCPGWTWAGTTTTAWVQLSRSQSQGTAAPGWRKCVVLEYVWFPD